MRLDIGHGEYNSHVDKARNPDENAGNDGIHRSPPQGVLNRESSAKVALDTDRSEAEGAVVDGHVEEKANQWTEHVGHIPNHVVHHFLHLEGQEEEKDKVRDGQVKEQDVNRCWFLPDFLGESVESKDIGWEAQDKGNDVDRHTQPSIAVLHDGSGGNEYTAAQGGLIC